MSRILPPDAFILADHCRHTNAGVVVQDRAQLDALNDRPIGSVIFHLETKENLVENMFLTFRMKLKYNRMTICFSLFRAYRPMITCFVIPIDLNHQ